MDVKIEHFPRAKAKQVRHGEMNYAVIGTSSKRVVALFTHGFDAHSFMDYIDNNTKMTYALVKIDGNILRHSKEAVKWGKLD